ncbi:hypothetical protein [Phyllobacterium sp. K27]
MNKTLSMIIIIASTSTSFAADQPFVGNWAGEITTCADPFRITAKTYAPPMSGKALRIKKIERDGKFWSVQLADGYRFTLFDVKKNTLTWHSPASGDTFDLKRCK